MKFRSKNRRLYGDLLNEFRPTLRSLIFNILYAKFLELKRTKEPFQPEDAKFRLPEEFTPYYDLEYLAVVKSGKVVEMIRINKETAEIIQSRGVKFIPFNPKEIKVKKGMKFVEGNFIGEENEEN